MRFLYFAFATLLGTCVSAQVSPDSSVTFTYVETDHVKLLTEVAWQELESSEKPNYLLVISPEGNFDEDAVSEKARRYRHLLGRWALDTVENTLTLGVDAFMGKDLVHARYREGRDFKIPYTIIELTQHELILKDVKTGRLRSFIATDLEGYEDQAQQRMPNKKKEEGFKLPNMGDFKL